MARCISLEYAWHGKPERCIGTKACLWILSWIWAQFLNVMKMVVQQSELDGLLRRPNFDTCITGYHAFPGTMSSGVCFRCGWGICMRSPVVSNLQPPSALNVSSESKSESSSTSLPCCRVEIAVFRHQLDGFGVRRRQRML